MSNRTSHGIMILLACLGLWMHPGACLSQGIAKDALNEAIALYEQNQFEEAAQQLSGMLESYPAMDSRVLMEVHKYSAFCHAILGERDRAKEEFKKVLRLNPGLWLDEAEFPPKITAAFGRAKSELDIELRRERNEQLRRTTRLEAGLRSAALPGWGQMYRGYTTKGYVLLGATIASAVGFGITRSAYLDAQDTYERAGKGADLDALFADVDKRADTVNRMAYILGGIWAYTFLDALIFAPSIQELPKVAARPERPSRTACLWQTGARTQTGRFVSS